MLKLLVSKATQSPLSFLAICFGLWFAAHSFFGALLVGFIALERIKKSIRKAKRDEPETSDAKSPATAAASQQTGGESQAASVTPIKRQYAKSAVVVPLKTGTDD